MDRREALKSSVWRVGDYSAFLQEARAQGTSLPVDLDIR